MEDLELDLNLDDVPSIRPSLYEINKSFDTLKSKDERYVGIVGEEEARMVLFTNFILGEKPVILKGSRASGKTNILEVVGMYARKPIVIASSSEKAYKRNEGLNKHSHFIIPEVNKVNEQTVEMLKDWGEGAPHQYTFTNAYKEPETVTIQPKPFATSIADENKNVNLLGEELMSRLTVVRTDSSIQQNVAVIKEKLNRYQNPFYRKGISQVKLKQYIEYVHSLPSIRQLNFIYPVGNYIYSCIPPLFTDSRRDTDKYVMNTFGITLFHFYDRLTISNEGKEYAVVTPADIWLNHVIYQNVLLDSSLKCGRIEKEILEIIKRYGDDAKKDDWGNTVKGMKINEIHTCLLKQSYTPTVDAVRKYCDSLMEIGYLTRNEEVRPFRYSLNPELQREYRYHVDWHELIEQCKFGVSKYCPEIADEYIHRYCEGEGLVVIHPFSGEKVNILDFKDTGFLNEEKKKEDNFSTFTDKRPIQKVVEEPIKLELPEQQDLGYVNVQDQLQEVMIKIFEDKQSHTGQEFIEMGYRMEDVDKVLNFLTKTATIFKEGNDKYRLL